MPPLTARRSKNPPGQGLRSSLQRAEINRLTAIQAPKTMQRYFRYFFWAAAFCSLATSSPAWPADDRCAEVSDPTRWTECLGRQNTSADAKLNLVYQKLVDALQGDADAIRRLRDAQRKWIAFRDAQCDLTLYAAQGGRNDPAGIAACRDAMAAPRTTDLASLLIPQKNQQSPSEEKVSGAGPDARPTWRADDAASLGVRFASPDLIENMKVSGVWFPEEATSGHGYSGPAVFIFTNISTGKTFGAAINGATLLPDGFWRKHGVANAETLPFADLLGKLRSMGVVEIALSSETRAKIVDCAPIVGGAPPKGAQHDQCLRLGAAAVDLQDLDFRGRKLFVFRQGGASQRGVDAYEVMELPFDKYAQGESLDRPLNQLDQLSRIDLTKRQIIAHKSGGACASEDDIYGPDPQQGDALRLIGKREYSSGPDGACWVEDYDATKTPDGEAYRFTLRSRRAAP